jgi:hypothetical protein
MRVAFWLAALAIPLWVWWIDDSSPADPRPQRGAVKPAASQAPQLPPPGEPQALVHETPALLIYSPHGWLARKPSWQSAAELPAGWTMVLSQPYEVRGVAALFEALALAEARALAEPRDALLPLSTNGWPMGIGLHCRVYPAWDLQELSRRDGAVDPLSAAQSLALNANLLGEAPQVDVVSDAFIVVGHTKVQAGAQLLLDSCRQELDWQRQGRAPLPGAPRGLYYPAFHATWQFGSGVKLDMLECVLGPAVFEERDETFAPAISVCAGGFILHAQQAGHAAAHALLDDARVIRAVQRLSHGSPRHRQNCFTAALSEDDPLARELGLMLLAGEFREELEEDARHVLAACVQRARPENREFSRWTITLMEELWRPAEMLPVIIRTTPEAERLNVLLCDKVLRLPQQEMLRQGLRSSLLARLPRNSRRTSNDFLNEFADPLTSADLRRVLELVDRADALVGAKADKDLTAPAGNAAP